MVVVVVVLLAAGLFHAPSGWCRCQGAAGHADGQQGATKPAAYAVAKAKRDGLHVVNLAVASMRSSWAACEAPAAAAGQCCCMPLGKSRCGSSGGSRGRSIQLLKCDV